MWLEKNTRILVDRIPKVTDDLINDEQRGFRAGRGGCVDQIFTLNEIDRKAREKKTVECIWVL